WVIAAAAKIDTRFAATLDCAIDADANHRPLESCEIYVRPVLLAHAAFLTVGVLAIAFAAETIFAASAGFWLAGLLAALGVVGGADLFSFVMTESLSFGMFSLSALALVRAVARGTPRDWALAGLAAGCSALVRPTFLLLVPLGLVLLVVAVLWRRRVSPAGV